MAEMELIGRFGDSGSGGLKIALIDASGTEAGFLWMRGSGTEPVFRIMADVRGGDQSLEALLLDRHAAMVRQADELVQ
jgi:phosphoglucomutase